jgi:hypothetical protein
MERVQLLLGINGFIFPSDSISQPQTLAANIKHWLRTDTLALSKSASINETKFSEANPCCRCVF